MSKQDLTLQTLNQADHCLNKVRLMKDQPGENIITKFVGLRAKIYSYLIDHGSKDKKQKAQKSL